jgi:hypothetical protein
VDDRLFETLDPTTRCFDHDGRRYLVTDTVGFIRRLPPPAGRGFAATLEETLAATSCLHVVDASAGRRADGGMVAAVDGVLAEVGAGRAGRSRSCSTRSDLSTRSGRRRLANPISRAPAGVLPDRRGLDELRQRLRPLWERFEAVGCSFRTAAGRQARRASTAVGTVDERSIAGGRLRARPAEPRRRAPVRAFLVLEEEASQEAPVTELLFQRLHEDAVVPDARYRAMRASTSSPARAPRSGRASVRRSARAGRRDSRGHAGFVQPRSGLAPTTASRC